MFDVTLTGFDALLKTFDAVAARVHSLQYTIPREFEDWRTQDMHSRYPTPQIIRRGRRLRVTKRIWNRGRGKAARHPRPKHRRRRGYSRRPVLRPELYEQLKERMINLVNETVQWP
jgi:hypothetical protein